MGADAGLVDTALKDASSEALSPKMRALLALADKVRIDALTVTEADIKAARDAGADDKAVHDTVLVTAAFSMFNRYVDGLGTWAPEDAAAYKDTGKRLAEKGYGV